jgi:hypothetical protein
MTIRELITKIGFTVDERGLEVYDKAIGRVYDKADGLYKNLNRAADGIMHIGQKMSMYISAPLAALATVSVMAKVKLEDLQNEWGTMLNSQEKGIVFTKEMMDLDEKSPYNTEQISAYAKELHGMGVQTDKILPKMKLFMDISAGSGLPLEFLLQTVQMIDNIGFATGRQLRRLIMSGAIDRKELGKMLGLDLSSGAGMKRMMALADRGKVTSGMIESIFQREGGPGGKYFGKAEERSHTLKKGFDNLWHSIFMLRAGIGDMLTKSVGLSNILQKLADWVNKLTDRINKLSPGWKTFLVVTGGIAFAIGPALIGIGKLLNLFIGLNSAMLFLRAAGFAQGAGGILGMFKGLGAGLGKVLVTVGPVIAMLTIVYFLIQDIYMYVKYGKDASLFGDMSKVWGKPFDDAINNIVMFFFDAWQAVRDWWDDLWADPWKTMRDTLLPDWLKSFLFHQDKNVFGKGATKESDMAQQYQNWLTSMGGTPAQLAGAPSSALSAGKQVTQINVNVTTPVVAGASEADKTAISTHAKSVHHEVAKKIIDSIYNQYK